MQRSQVLVVAAVALLVAVPGAAAGTVNHNAVTGQPDLETSVPDTEVQPGEQTALTVIIYNDGRVTDGSPSNPDAEQQVKTARSVRVEVEDDHDAPVTVNTNEQFLASLPDGGSAPLDFGLTVDRNATPGEYELTVNASYNYTRAVDLETGRTERASTDETFNVTLVVEETPQFEVVDVASSARVGATGSVNVTMENTGAETARNASVSLTSRNTDLTFAGAGSASRYVDGPWEPGERRTVGYRVAATRSASQQRYAFAAQVTYENTEGNTRQSRSLSLGVTPEPEQTFTVVETAHGVEVGEEGEVTVRLRNDGPVVARDASVTLQSSSGELVFGESASARQYVGRWATGATRTVVVNATALPGAEARNYSLTATVSYEDGEGDSTESRPLQFGLRPAPEREVEFDESDVSSNLRVGEDGTLSGTITNTGEERATNVVVVFETESGTVTPLEREYPVGTLEPGDSASFEFDIEVSGSAEARPRQFTLRPRYRTDDDEQRQGESFDVRGEVQPERDIFDVSATNRSVGQGETALVELEVTNAGDETLTDVSASMFADDPISVEDSDAFAGELAPGDSTTLTFEISSDSDAIRKQYPVEVDFQYDEPDGDTKLSSGYTVGIEVTEADSSGGGPPLAVVAVVALVAIVAVVVYVRYGR